MRRTKATFSTIAAELEEQVQHEAQPSQPDDNPSHGKACIADNLQGDQVSPSQQIAPVSNPHQGR